MAQTLIATPMKSLLYTTVSDVPLHYCSPCGLLPMTLPIQNFVTAALPSGDKTLSPPTPNSEPKFATAPVRKPRPHPDPLPPPPFSGSVPLFLHPPTPQIPAPQIP
eukprot:747097-Hanusia_phi.AAC.3